MSTAERVSYELPVGTLGENFTSREPCVQRLQFGLVSSHWGIDEHRGRGGQGVRTFIFLTRHVKQPVVLRVYLGRLRPPSSGMMWWGMLMALGG